MSVKVSLRYLTEDMRRTINTQCYVRGTVTDYNKNPKVVKAYQLVTKTRIVDGKSKEVITDVILPINFALSKFGRDFVAPFMPEKQDYPRTTYKFNGSLYPEQMVVAKEAADTLKKTGSCMLNIHCGGGKCMAPDTPVVMADGSLQQIDHINVHDQVMGDDGTPRNVTALAAGIGAMYEVTLADGESFTVTENHELCMIYLTGTFERKKNTLVTMTPKQYLNMHKVERKRVGAYRITLPFSYTPLDDEPYRLGYQAACNNALVPIGVSRNCKAVRSAFLVGVIDARRYNWKRRKYDPVYIQTTAVDKDVPDVNLRVRDGWFSQLYSHDEIGVSVSSLQFAEELMAMAVTLGIRCEYKSITGRVVFKSPYPGISLRKLLVTCARVPILYIPPSDSLPTIGEARSLSEGDASYQLEAPRRYIDGKQHRRNRNRKRRRSTAFDDGHSDTQRAMFVRQFCSDQIMQFPVHIKSIKYVGQGPYAGIVVDGNHKYILPSMTVTHNTVLTTYLCSKMRQKTVVFVAASPNLLIPQWLTSIKKFTDAKACKLTSNMKIEKYTKLIQDNDIVLMNIDAAKKFPDEMFRQFGTAVVDEAHAAVTEKRIVALHKVSPRYLLLLTGTMDRTDGMYNLLWLFVTHPSVVRELNKPFNVFYVPTGIEPQYDVDRKNRPVWTSVLENIAQNSERNKVVAKLAAELWQKHGRNIIILCKLRAQVHEIADMLISEKRVPDDEVEKLMGSQKWYNGEAGILVSTYSKSGVGFDHPKLNCLIMATDVKEGIEQYVGRIFRRATPDEPPWVFDLVDKMNSLTRHWRERRHWYESHGATVIQPRSWRVSNPEFEFLATDF